MRGSSPRLPTTFQVANNGGIMEDQYATISGATRSLEKGKSALKADNRSAAFLESIAESLLLIVRALRTR